MKNEKGNTHSKKGNNFYPETIKHSEDKYKKLLKDDRNDYHPKKKKDN